MPSPGFIYVLINPVLPGLVKIGKTGRTPDERARELQGTGLPTPFAVAYQVYVQDCECVEQAVHSFLEKRRVADNREFFSTSIEDAVSVVSLASRVHDSEGATSKSDRHANLDLSNSRQALLNEADNSRYGWNGRLLDEEHAIKTFEKAAAIGALEAYLSLGDLLLMRATTVRECAAAVSWLKKGAELGYRWCWSRLSEYYKDGRLDSSDLDGHNARVCLGNLLRKIEPEWIEDDWDERTIIFNLRDYVDLCAANPSRTELFSMEDALLALAAKIGTLPDPGEQSARRDQLEGLRARIDTLRL